MKRFHLLVVLGLGLAALPLRAQDTANPGAAAIASRQDAEENYNILKGRIEDMAAAQADQQKHLQAVAKELEEVRQLAGKPQGNFATQEEVDKLAQAVRELDKKREEDKRLILEKMDELGKLVAAPVGRPTRNSGGRDNTSATDNATPIKKPATPIDPNQTGFYYVIKSGDYLSLIAQAYREQGVKVTTRQILDANPGLDDKKLYVGRKIFIPAPKNSGTK